MNPLESAERSPWTSRRVAAALALVSIPVLLSTLETVMFAGAAGHPIAVWRAFVGEAPQWYTWVLLAPAIVALAERYRLQWPVGWRAATIHAAGFLVSSAIVAFADAIVNQWARPSASGLGGTFRNWFVGSLPATTLVYFAIIAVSYALTNGARLRDRERRAAMLETQLREAQLGALRMQLQPHFLFNSLNAIMALVRDQETARAVRALSLLSDVLRTAVGADGAHETTLAREIAFVTQYLEIERVRFEDRLRVSFDVAPDVADALVPTFVLQPFVENSLKHGVLRGKAGNTIALGARAEGATLLLSVRDDGRGLAAAAHATGGVGISNARARLLHMYGPEARLSVYDCQPGTGVHVEIALPLRRAAAS